MMARLGIELGVRALRGVRLEGWFRPRARVVEIECDPANPAEAVDALRQHLGPTRRIALALELPFLFMKRFKLPPLGESEKRNILRLEPERFFPVRAEEIVPAVRAEDDLVFATKEAPLATWVAALEELGQVDLIEPGPLALARALARARITSALVLLDAQADGLGFVEIRDGQQGPVGGEAEVARATNTGRAKRRREFAHGFSCCRLDDNDFRYRCCRDRKL